MSPSLFRLSHVHMCRAAGARHLLSVTLAVSDDDIPVWIYDNNTK